MSNSYFFFLYAFFSFKFILFNSILDIWDAHKSQLSALGIDPTIGNVKPNDTTVVEDEENRVTCCVKAQLFPCGESYRLSISSSKVKHTFVCELITL